jgi:hypothetical protein
MTTNNSQTIPLLDGGSDGILSLYLGGTESGKSHLAISVYNAFYRDVYDLVIIFAPTYYSRRNSKIYQKLKVPKDKKLLVYTYFNLELLEEVTNKIPTDNENHILLIMDDCIDQFQKTLRSDNNVLSTLAFKGRHRLISIWILSQALRCVSTTIRSNSTNVFLHRYNDTNEIEKFSSFAGHSKKVFLEKYNHAMDDNTNFLNSNYPFVYIYKNQMYNRLTKM